MFKVKMVWLIGNRVTWAKSEHCVYAVVNKLPHSTLSLVTEMKRFSTAIVLTLTLAITAFSLPTLSSFAQVNISSAKKPTRTTRRSAPFVPQYRKSMQLGYLATKLGDYQTALINFKRALAERPNDPYARKAVQNTQAYINVQRRQSQADALTPTLKLAMDAQDWSCAVQIVDRMITLNPKGSQREAQLIAYRSQLAGAMNSPGGTATSSGVCSSQNRV